MRDLVEKLRRHKDVHLNLTGCSSRRTARTILHDAYLPDELSGANLTQEDGLAIEFAHYVDGAAKYAKNTVWGISLSEENLPFDEVHASHFGSFKGRTSRGCLRNWTIAVMMVKVS